MFSERGIFSKITIDKLVALFMLALFIINIIYLNDMGNDAAVVTDYAKHLATQGKPVVSLRGNVFGNSGYNFTYFPLFPAIVAGIIKLTGLECLAVKIASLFFYCCNIAVLCFLCRRVSPKWLSYAIVIFYALDPLIVKDTMSGLYGSFFWLCFLSIFLII